MRNRAKLNIVPRQKPQASAPVQVRRTNPLLARRKAVTNPEPSEAPIEATQEVSETEPAAAEVPVAESEPAEQPSSTTEEPRGLNKLLAGRRRLAARQPGTIL